MKCVQDSEISTQTLRPFFLLGLLANYNKFEFQNPYRLRLDDFVNDATICKIVTCFGSTCSSARDRYVAVQDDLPEGWNLGATLSYIGLGVLATGSRPSTPTAEEAVPLFSALYVWPINCQNEANINSGRARKLESFFPLMSSLMRTNYFASILSIWPL